MDLRAITTLMAVGWAGKASQVYIIISTCQTHIKMVCIGKVSIDLWRRWWSLSGPKLSSLNNFCHALNINVFRARESITVAQEQAMAFPCENWHITFGTQAGDMLQQTISIMPVCWLVHIISV